jgi:AraC-like DNA-binding protein
MPHFFKLKGILSGFHAEEPDLDNPELTHAGEEWAPREYKIDWHEHDVWEFYFQIDGMTEWRSRGKRYRVRAGGLLAVPPGLPHALIDRPGSSHHYYFAGIDLRSVFRRLPHLQRGFDHKSIINRANVGAIGVPFRQLIREISLNLPYRSNGIRMAIDSLVIEIARSLAARPGKSLIAIHPAVKRAQDLIDQRPQESWPILKLARMSGLSVSRLNECFRAELSMSPHQYLLHRRLDLAAELLRQNNQAITEMALELGFSSSQHFALSFRKRFGLSACQYRRGKVPRSKTKILSA